MFPPARVLGQRLWGPRSRIAVVPFLLSIAVRGLAFGAEEEPRGPAPAEAVAHTTERTPRAAGAGSIVLSPHAEPLPAGPVAPDTLRAEPPARPIEATAPPAAASTEATTSDAALLRALVAIFNPWASLDARSRALADPALADPRAMPVVTFMLGDSHREIRAAAATALARFPGDPRVEEALIRSANDALEPTVVRLAAVRALGRVGTAPASSALVALTADDGQDLELRTAARAALEIRFPELAARARATEVVDRGGRSLLGAGSAILGAFTLGAVGALGRNDAGATIGALGGALVGAGTAVLLTRTGEITSAQAGWMVTAGMWGATAGMLFAGSVTREPSTRLTLSLGLLGEGAAFGAALATRKSIPFSAGDVAFTNVAGLAGVDLTAGALLMGEGDHVQLGRGLLVGGALVGLGAGAVVTRELELTRGDRVLAAESSYEGLALGFLAGRGFDASDRRVGGASLLGLGAGFVSGVAMTQVTDYGVDDVGFVVIFGSYGKALGASVPMLADASNPKLAMGALIGGATSLGAAHLLHDRLEFRPGAVPFVALSTAIGFWHGLALGRAATSLSQRQQEGASYLGGVVGGLLSVPLVQLVSPTSTEVLAMAGGAFWGTWIAAWSATLGDASDPTTLRLALAASDVGLVTAAVLVSPLCQVDARRIGIANLGGLAGAGLVSLVAALATKSSDTVITANLVGSGVGLLGGAVLAASLELSPLPERAGGSDSRASASAKAGLLDRLLTSVPTPRLIPLLVTGPRGQAGTPSAMGLALIFAEEPSPPVVAHTSQR